MAKWKDLEAKGIKRCCAMFINGSQCRKRAVESFNYSWCAKHGPIIKKHTDFAMKALKEQYNVDSK